jgi:phosphatidylglycerol lysyltransferase
MDRESGADDGSAKGCAVSAGDAEHPLLDEPDEPAPDIPPDEERSGILFSVLLLRLRAVWPWLILGAVTFIGWEELQRVNLTTVRRIFRATPAETTLALLGLVALNLAVAGLYDVAALGPLSRGPRAGARWTTGVLSFAWSNFLTVGPLAGPALRLWLYRPLGVEGVRARGALGAVLASFSVGLVAWCGAVLVPLPPPLDGFVARILVAAALAAAAGALLRVLPQLRIAPPSVRAWEGSPWDLAGVAAVDWLLAWTVFHVALSAVQGGITPSVSLRAFFLGQLVGLVSFIPGGLGSADAFWIFALARETGGHDRIFAALVLYRVVYYVLPWAAATLVLVGRLVRTRRWSAAFIRSTMASYAFVCGAVLLASAATPALSARLAFLNSTIPLAVVEISHGASVLLGFMLLVVSRGLARGYRSSHRVAVALFVAGALTTFLKGLDFEEALIAILAAALLVVFREPFSRPGRLHPSVEFVVSAGLFAVVLFAALGFGSYVAPSSLGTEVQRFGHHAQEGRFLRSLILLGALAGAVSFHLAQRGRARDPLPDEEGIERAIDETRRMARSTNPLLVACADKAVFRPRPGDGVPPGFIAYRTAGKYLVAYSDPICPAGEEPALLVAFLDEAAASDRDVILYQISAALLPVAHDLGFTFFKLGEEAVVDLTRFDLKGNKAKTLRHSVNAVEKAGGRFEIVEGDAIRPLMPELRSVSDEWLRIKGVSEKQFSIGRFDERYLLRFPCAVVRDADGAVAAFANVLEGPNAGEMSVDLMRHRATDGALAPLKDVMDFLFIKLMLHAKERGCTRFNLGMAPLAAVGEMRWARPVERLAHVFFRYGESWYNYQGLRRFKEKFDPIWEPRYMAYPKPWDWPRAITSTAVLIAGGWRAVLFPSKGLGRKR